MTATDAAAPHRSRHRTDDPGGRRPTGHPTGRPEHVSDNHTTVRSAGNAGDTPATAVAAENVGHRHATAVAAENVGHRHATAVAAENVGHRHATAVAAENVGHRHATAEHATAQHAVVQPEVVQHATGKHAGREGLGHEGSRAEHATGRPEHASGRGSGHPAGRRRAQHPGGRRRAGRLRELLVSGVVDSFGLSLGWTLFNLIATQRGGLAMAALFNSAMLLGVVLSAPVVGRLARRLHGRTLLLLAGCTEAVLRVATLAALLHGVNATVIAAGVTVMHIAAYTGFAAMRAEVAAVDARPRAMTRYALSIAAVEAAGAGVAALLPLHTASLAVVFAVYGLSLLPTMLTARRARTARNVPPPRPTGAYQTRVERRRAEHEARGVRVPLPVLAAGGGITLLAAGPTLLSVALATELHGQHAVAGAAAAFSAGCLLSSWAVDRVGRLRLPAAVTWPLWGVGMLIGWLLAPAHLFGLFLAQFLSGLSMTAFEGGMDARLAQAARPGTVTTVLAWSASTRALGSAIAVRTLPLLVAAPAVGSVAGTAAAVLALISLTVLVRAKRGASPAGV
ncbi:hypothetical protein [Dactylosporangium sp. CS-033363]|uniref:hypothetical protein n=1 Tax=Dactylosporangium sp. CS-033363 TaxID=3239935 RepID=UPI003D8C7C33